MTFYDLRSSQKLILFSLIFTYEKRWPSTVKALKHKAELTENTKIIITMAVLQHNTDKDLVPLTLQISY
jgi:hypothetical protein